MKQRLMENLFGVKIGDKIHAEYPELPPSLTIATCAEVEVFPQI